LNDVAAGGLNIDKILTQVVLKKNNGENVKRLLDTLDVDTAAFRKQRFKKIVDDKEVSTGRVDRSKAPTRSALEFSDKQREILAEAEIDVKDPVFKNKEQVKGVLQKEFLRDIVTRIQKGSDIVNYKQIANTIEGYGTTADTLFGPTGKRELVKSLREADQIVNVGTVDELDDLLARTANVDNVIEDLTAKVAAQSELDEIAKLDVFNRIKNGTIDSENIVNTLFKSGNSEDIAAVKQLLGPESVEFKEFQTAAMRKILNQYVNPGDDAIEKLFKDDGFYKAILSPDGYGQAVLKETFGDAQYDLLKKAAARSKFLVGGEKAAQGGGLFTQGLLFNIIFRPLQALPQFTILSNLSRILGRPGFVKWLAGEIPDKAFLKNELPSLYDALGVGQPIRRSIGIQSITEPVREASEYAERQFENQRVDPKSPIALDLPEIEPANLSAQNQTTPRSLNLLGGNMANLDIAQRIDRDIQRLV
jgi:F0F1-type ATP synthase gamma subunit